MSNPSRLSSQTVSSLSSFSWPSLSNNKRRLSDSVDPLKDENISTTNNLNTIDEASNENSENSTKSSIISAANNKTSNAGGNSNGTRANNNDAHIMPSNWWFWSKSEQVSYSEQIEVARVEEAVDPGETWSDWTSTYGRVGSVVSYVYKKGSTIEQPQQQPTQANETTAFVSGNNGNQLTDSKLPQEVASNVSSKDNNDWFSWLWTKVEPINTEENEEENDSDLFKSAKSAIENSKETSHYAFKSSNQESPKDFELAVSDTQTENQPVKYSSKKRPLTPNEVQERALQQPLPNGSVKSGINSSNSSLNIAAINKQNLILPNIDENYRTITLTTKLRLIGEHILYHKNSSESHLYKSKSSNIINKKKHKLKKIVIVGIHGFLPIKMVKTLIGQPTGTSVKFVNEATNAFKKWLVENNNEDLNNYDIQTIALEGEGKIEERVSKLFKLLENWFHIISNSDFLFFVSHSQGTPVAINLLAELLSNHNLGSKKIGLLSMSGINCGPFAGLDSKLVIRAFSPIENEIINELFELQKPNSLLSLKLNQSMKVLIKHNVKITFSASINDQLIPIFSAVSNDYSHPNIFRFIFVDKNCDLPDFMVTLFKIIIIMKNMGYSDHNLLKDLSEKCMGSINDGGHSKIYQDENVYLMAIKHTLETTSLTQHRSLLITPILNIRSQSNLYTLPWNIRGLLNDLIKIKNISNLNLITQLINDFNKWEPTQKYWKELRYCFNALEDVDLEDLAL